MNMPREHKLEPPLDFEELCGSCLGKRDFARKLVEQFANSLPEYFDNVPEDIDVSHLREICADTHKLKGTAATLFAHAISGAATEVDAAANTGDLERVVQSYPLLLREIERFLDWVNQWDCDRSEQ